MQVLNFMKTKNSVSALWQSLVGKAEVDRGFDPYEREPVLQSEISEMLASHYRQNDSESYSNAERRDHDNLSAIRSILYPPSAA